MRITELRVRPSGDGKSFEFEAEMDDGFFVDAGLFGGDWILSVNETSVFKASDDGNDPPRPCYSIDPNDYSDDEYASVFDLFKRIADEMNPDNTSC